MYSSQAILVKRKDMVESLPIASVSTILISNLSDNDREVFPDKQKEWTAPDHSGGVITKLIKRKILAKVLCKGRKGRIDASDLKVRSQKPWLRDRAKYHSQMMMIPDAGML